MARISYKRRRFPSAIIQHAVWLYFRFTLSLRDVEEMLAQRGIDVSYETIRCWTIKFGPKIPANLNGGRDACRSRQGNSDLRPAGEPCRFSHRLSVGRQRTLPNAHSFHF